MFVEPIVPPPTTDPDVDPATAARVAAGHATTAREALERTLGNLTQVLRPALKDAAERHHQLLQEALADAEDAVLALEAAQVPAGMHVEVAGDLRLALGEARDAVVELGVGPALERARDAARKVRLATGVVDRAVAALMNEVREPAHPGTNTPVTERAHALA